MSRTRPLPASNVRLVQVGDHPAEPSEFARRRQAETFACKKVDATAEEILGLRDRLFDASLKLRASVNMSNFAGVRSASIDLDEISHQLREMSIGLSHAVEQAMKEIRG